MLSDMIRLCVLASLVLPLTSAVVVTSVQTTVVDPALIKPIDRGDRLRVLVGTIEFAGERDRDGWLGIAFEELLARRLRRAPDLIVVPTVRGHDAIADLSDDPRKRPSGEQVARAVGATALVSGRASGTALNLTLDLSVLRLGETAPRQTKLTTARWTSVLDEATRWLIAEFGLELQPEDQLLVFEPSSSSDSAVEAYAKAVTAARANRVVEVAHFCTEALGYDPRFRPAHSMLSKIHLARGPEGRNDALTHARRLTALAREASDDLDRAGAELDQALLLQFDASSEAAITRLSTALRIAQQKKDPYVQLAALEALCGQRVADVAALSADDNAGRLLRAEILRDAVELQRGILAAARGLSDGIGEVSALVKLGSLLRESGDPDELTAYQDILPVAERLASRRSAAAAWVSIADFHQRAERWDDAIAALEQCLSTCPRTAEPGVRALLGGVYERIARLPEALLQFEIAYSGLKDTTQLIEQLMCLDRIAELRMALGRRSDAIAALRDAIDVAHAMELPQEKDYLEKLNRWMAEK